jgi:hypothetical protein
MLRRTALPALLPLLSLAPLAAACPGGGAAADYYRMEQGLSWDYYLISEGGAEDEAWALQVLDADENEETSIGDLFFRLQRSYTDESNPSQTYTLDQRKFNLRLEEDETTDPPAPIGWTYRWVNQDEGERGEYFVKVPGADTEWSDDWDYEIEGDAGGSDFGFEVHAERWAEPVEASLGTYDDTIAYTRTVTITSFGLDGDELVQVQEHHEYWAAGVGLVRYLFVHSDGDVSEVVLRSTDAVTDE